MTQIKTGKMYIVALFISTLFYRVRGHGECADIRGKFIDHGNHYVPGPDKCKLCVCDNGEPTVCKEVLCSPPQDCRSFRVGSTCCEFICLDDVLKPAEPSAAVRVIGGVSSVLLLVAISYMFYRAFKGRSRPPHGDDQRSLTSIGYISGSMAYVGGSCETGVSSWKPPSNYLPRGEAPPPYEEAVAQSRAEAMSRLQAEPAYHRAYPVVENMSRPEDIHYPPHSFANIPRQIMQIPNMQNCYNAPLLQTVHQPESLPANVLNHHPLAPNGFSSSVALGGSLGAISGRSQPVAPMAPVAPTATSMAPVGHREERPLLSSFYATTHHTPMHGSFHRTIPRISTAGTILDTSLPNFTRNERSLQNEIRRSFHKHQPESRSYAETGRSMPRIYLTSNTDLHSTNDGGIINRSLSVRPRILSEGSGEKQKNMPKINKVPKINNVPQTSHMPHNVPQSSNMPHNVPQSNNMPHNVPHSSNMPHNVPQSNNMPHNVPHSSNMPHNVPQSSNMPPINIVSHSNHVAHVNTAIQKNSVQQSAQSNKSNLTSPQNTLPLTVDKPSCVCSYEAPSAEEIEETDDYRSECENCKSTSSSRWVLESGWDSMETSVTLERRSNLPAPEPPASATLPTSHRPSRNPMGPTSNWDSWFNAIPDSDTESEE